MTVLSPRHAPAAIALLVAVALPVWFHAVVRPVHEDCANPSAFFEADEVAGAAVEPLTYRQWEGVEGRVVDGTPISVRAVRGFDPSSFYWDPVRFGFESQLYLQRDRVRRLEVGDDVLPVHWRSDEALSWARIEAYLFVQGGMPVRHPVQSGLALVLPQLLRGTRPVTLLIVFGASPREELPALERAAERWLAAAWRELEAACGGGG